MGSLALQEVSLCPRLVRSRLHARGLSARCLCGRAYPRVRRGVAHSEGQLRRSPAHDSSVFVWLIGSFICRFLRFVGSGPGISNHKSPCRKRPPRLHRSWGDRGAVGRYALQSCSKRKTCLRFGEPISKAANGGCRSIGAGGASFGMNSLLLAHVLTIAAFHLAENDGRQDREHPKDDQCLVHAMNHFHRVGMIARNE